MKGIVAIVFLVFNSFHLICQFNLNNQLTSSNVLYGERDLSLDSSSIFIDKNVFFYPHYPISDSSLKVSNYSLLDWYFVYEEDFIKIGLLYNCNFEAVNKQEII